MKENIISTGTADEDNLKVNIHVLFILALAGKFILIQDNSNEGIVNTYLRTANLIS